jgi:hypothetical protein
LAAFTVKVAFSEVNNKINTIAVNAKILINDLIFLLIKTPPTYLSVIDYTD